MNHAGKRTLLLRAHAHPIVTSDFETGPCQAHRSQDGRGCVVRDGMDAIYQLFEDVHGLILGTPVYYNSVPAQMKMMMDRSVMFRIVKH